MNLTKAKEFLLWIASGYIQFILCILTQELTPVLANISIAILLTASLTLIFGAVRNRSKKALWIFAGIQLTIWLIFGFLLFPAYILLLFLSSFMLFGLSAKALAILFSNKLGPNHG